MAVFVGRTGDEPVLNGTNENDRIVGAVSSVDWTINGGRGDDGVDTILNFENDIDKIDLSSIVASTNNISFVQNGKNVDAFYNTDDDDVHYATIADRTASDFNVADDVIVA